jgi:hypothetical protein
MKLLLLLSLCAAALVSSQSTDIFTGTTPYQACVTSRTTLVGGTACLVFQPTVGVLIWTVVHSFDVEANQIGGTLSFGLPVTITIAPDFTGPTAPRNRMYWMASLNNQQLPASPSFNTAFLMSLTLTTLTVPPLSLTWSFDLGTITFGNNFNNNQLGQPSIYLGYNTQFEVMPASRNKDGMGYQVPTTYVETFKPFGNNVLIRRQTGNNLNYNNVNNVNYQGIVVAVGPTVQYSKEGETVLLNVVKCVTQLVQLNDVASNTDDILALSPYCFVSESDIIGKVREGSYFANRAYVNSAHIKKAATTTWSTWVPQFSA